MASSGSTVRPIESRSVAELVTSELRRSIVNGALAPGQEFSLREVAGMLNVSFIPVREALRSLEAEGLVINRPGRSSMVAPLDLDDLHAIYRLRHDLEPNIAARACHLLTDAELDRLDQQATEFGDHDRGIDEIYEAHHAFHLALLKPAAAEWDTRILGTLWRAAERYIRIGFGRLDPDPHEHGRREHAHHDLLEAFRSRDIEAVRQGVHDHLEHNEQLALRALEPAAEPAAEAQ
jgi:DNA-binding GntR family transcriptional regulator